MDYAISRAHEIKRLDYEQQISLKVFENNSGRCLFPHEIQERLVLPPLKATYTIPEIEAAQASHTQRIRGEFYKTNIYPKYEHLSPLDIEKCHEFDEAINQANIDFVYSGGSKRRNLREEVED